MSDRDAPGLGVFNALPEDVATARLCTCLNAPGWAASVLAGRPYPDRESLLATAYRFGIVLEDADFASAMSRHPRIGERLGKEGAGQEGTGQEGTGQQGTGDGGSAGSDRAAAAHSQAEQSGVDAADTDLADRLAAGNRAYEERFGQVFLIRAAGRSGPQILEALATRLMNDPRAEATIVREQLAQIAQLRLDALLIELADADGSVG